MRVRRRGVVGAAEDSAAAVCAVPDQPLGIARAERASAPEQIHRLEKRGLAGAVAAPDQIVAGMELELRLIEAAEILDAELEQDS